MNANDFARVAHLDEDGNDKSYATIPKTVLEGLSENEATRVRVITDDDASGQSAEVFNRYGQPREATFPAGVGADDTDPNGGTVDYESLTNARLEAEIQSRNDRRPAESHIQVTPPGNKADLVAALEADDHTIRDA